TTRIMVPLVSAFHQGLGEVYVEAGFLLSEDPPIVRQPDLAFLTLDQAARMPDEGYLQGAPAIAFEVVSPSESASDLEIKIRQYLASGSLAVVVVFPATRTVWVHRRGAGASRLEGDDVLSFPDILGEWALPLPGIFTRKS